MKLPKLVMTDKERAQRAALPRAARAKLAATIVLICGPKDNPRILMGQRASRHDFMPSVYVFPGGRVDRGDSYAAYEGDLSPRTETILEAAYSPRRARALVLAAIRETYEETGLCLTRPLSGPAKSISHPSWRALAAKDQTADMDGIEVFGRAITPPHRHKRFDTWFFVKDMNCETPPPASDSNELLNVDWFTFDQIEDLKTHRATDMMLMVLKKYLSHDTAPRRIFFNHMRRGKFIQADFPPEN